LRVGEPRQAAADADHLVVLVGDDDGRRGRDRPVPGLELLQEGRGHGTLYQPGA
jgi:hypothetical protein